jgi:hypothetical protein
MRQNITDRSRFLNQTGMRLAIIGNLLLMMLIFPLHAPITSMPLKIGEATVKEVNDSTSAGYVANYTSLAQSVDDVKGFWKVPTVQSSIEQTAVLESVAIGSGDTIIQVGTSQVSHNGAVVYDAWYWVAPEGGGGPTTIDQLNGKVEAGKVIGAEIHKGSGNTWTLGIISGTLSGFPDSFYTQVTHTAGLPSADWLVQPIQPGIPLANFGSTGFFWTNATIDGSQSRLDQLQNQRLNLVDTSRQCNLAGTSEINPSNGDSFIVSFIQAIGPCSTQKTSNAPSLNFLIPLVIGGVIIAGVIILVVTLVILSTRKKNASTGPSTWQNLAQPVTPSPVRICTSCNSPLQPGARFCHSCGKQIL